MVNSHLMCDDKLYFCIVTLIEVNQYIIKREKEG